MVAKTRGLGLSGSIIIQIGEACEGDEKAVVNVGEARIGRVTPTANSKGRVGILDNLQGSGNTIIVNRDVYASGICPRGG